MAFQYQGGTNINATFTGDTKADLIAGIETNLVAAGWSEISGAMTTNIMFQSVLTPQGNQLRLNVYDGGANCVRLKLYNVAETISQTDSCYLFPAAATTFRIIAGRYQFACFVPGSTNTRNFVLCSSIYIPGFLTTLTTAAFIMGDGGSDTDTSNARGSFRTSLTSVGPTFAPAQECVITDSNKWETSNATNDGLSHPGLISVVAPQSAAIDAISGYRWHDDSGQIIEPLVAWGLTGLNDEGKIRGQLWDSFLATESFPMDILAPTPVDSHNWYNITSSNAGSVTVPATARGSIYLVIP